jgi:hypothetical protein
MIYEEKDRTSLRKALLFPYQFLYQPIAPLTKIMVVVLLCLRFFPTGRPGPRLRLNAATWTVLLGLTATPVLVALLFRLHAPGSGFYPRYSIAAVCPMFILVAALLAWRSGDNAVAGWIVAIAALLGAFVTFRQEPAYLHTIAESGLLSAPKGFDQTAGLDTMCPDLPVVMNYALDFFEADARFGPNKMARMVYVTDPALSLRVEHETATESIQGMAKTFQLPHRVIPSTEFLPTHRQFLLLSRLTHSDWLLDYLQQQHAGLVPLGERRFAGEHERLWYVSLDEPQPVTPACVVGASGR